MGRRAARRLAVGVAIIALASACSTGGGGPDAVVRSAAPATTGGGATSGGEGSGGQMDPDGPTVDEPITPGDDQMVMGSAGGSNTADDVMLAAGLAAEDFWTRTFPEVYGEEFEPLDGGFWTYGPDTPAEDLPPCAGITAYEDIAQNAFYCPDADLIAWDREALVAPFIDAFGEFGAAIIMAHEVGHQVQGRTGDLESLPPVIAELQADCFAGSWVADVVDGGSEDFAADTDQLDLAVAGQIEVRDAPGSDPNDPRAHGSGFDRVSALSDGIFEGAARCADYGAEPPVVTEAVFSPTDAATGGDVATDQLLDLVRPSLDAFYTDLFAEEGRQWDPVDDVILFDPATDEVACGGTTLTPDEAAFNVFYCVEDDTVQIDGAGLVPALEMIGDFAVGAEVARQWAFSAQDQAGVEAEDKGIELHADCLTGLWAGDLFVSPTTELSLSPGDLDEGIISFLATQDSTSRAASPFERSDAFRTGFLGGLEDCDALLG